MVELIRKIRKRYQREIGLIHDLIVETIFNFFPGAVLHGGTFIWRCFKGNRFSEDLDFYIERKNERRIKEFFKNLKEQGFEIKKLRIKERSVYSKLSFGKIEVRVEIVFKKVKAELFDYECMDGRILPIRGLKVEDLVEEKANAFLKRKKMRDLYDIYFLLKFVKKNSRIRKIVEMVVENFKKPKDEEEIDKLIIFGYAPKSEEIIEYLRRWVK